MIIAVHRITFHYSITGARCCKAHLTDTQEMKDDVQIIPNHISNRDSAHATSDEILELLDSLCDKLQERKRVLDFDDPSLLDDADYVRLTGKSVAL